MNSDNRLGGQRILVVEDNPILAFDLDDALRDGGASVVGPALDIQQGLRLATQSACDAAVLDIDIGGHPVWPIARVLREDGIPLIFVSGECADTMPGEFAGAICLSKPARTETVLACVCEAIDRR